MHARVGRTPKRAILLLGLLLVSVAVRQGLAVADTDPIRPDVLAGSWYPGEPDALRRQVDRFLDLAPEEEVRGEVVALIAPHAGYAYSGPTAAVAYRQVRGRSYDAVVVLAPSHREPFRGASVYAGGSYRTPLGLVSVDSGLADAIVSGGGSDVHAGLAGHRVSPGGAGEHSLEIQLPFLQRVLPEVPIVPIVVGAHDLGACRRIAEAIASAAEGRRVLIVASSDLYHGYSRKACVDTDARTLGLVRAMDETSLYGCFEDGKCQACGDGPILIALMAARSLGADRAEILARTNSSDVTGETGGWVVGYGAVAFVAADGGDPKVDTRVPEEACDELLRIARRSVERCTRGEALSPPESEHPALAESRGVFVTLTLDGRLRGCIGSLVAAAPLGVGVQQMARKAALRDPRFRPVRPEEVEKLHIEISVLTPLRPLDDVLEVEVGRHGLLIAQGNASGVLLPQVPVELGWDRRTFLEQVCRKAGLPTTAYLDDDVRLWTFEAQVFGEE